MHDQVLHQPTAQPASLVQKPALELNSVPDEKVMLPVQCKLFVSSADDPLEREAEEVANHITDTPSQSFAATKTSRQSKYSYAALVQAKPFVQMKCNECEREEAVSQELPADYLQRKTSATGQAEVPSGIATQIVNQKGSGSVMPPVARSFMEEKFGASFNNVKLHTDHKAASLSNALSAEAFTIGNDIFFNEGKFSPHTKEGQNLLAHELTHVLQQSSSGSTSVQRRFTRGEVAEDGIAIIQSTATSTAGMLRDVIGFAGSVLSGHSFRTIFIITQNGLSVYNFSSQRQAHYPLREDMPMPPYGLWGMAGGRMEMLGIRGDRFVIEQRSVELENFSPARLEVVRNRGSVLLADFVQIQDEEFTRRNFLPALIYIGQLPVRAGGRSGESEAWAEGQVRDLNRSIRESTSSTPDTPASERNMTADRKTPDRIVHWAREDGKQFINVWVNGEVRSLELQEGESTEELKDRVQEATEGLRNQQQSQAISQEEQATGGNIPFTDSTFLGGTDNGRTANRPAFRATVTGPEVMVRSNVGSEGSYVMRLHYEDEFRTLLGQVAEAYIGAEYVWQVIDITNLYQQVLRERAERVPSPQSASMSDSSSGAQPVTRSEGERTLDNIGRRDAVSTHDSVTAGDVVFRDVERTSEYFQEDVGQAWNDLTNPIESQDGSAEAAMRSVLVNTFNLSTTPLHAIFSMGGLLIRSFAAIFEPHDRYEQTIPFPNRDGYYLVRCVAQPRPRGEGENQIIRAPSVAVKVVQVKEIREQTQAELNSQSQTLQANILELLISYRLTTDQRELASLRQLLELKVQEASHSNRTFLEQLIQQRQTEADRPDLDEAHLAKISEEISILQQGTQSGSGMISNIISRQIAIKERELEQIRQTGNPFRIRDAERELTQLRERLGTAAARESEMSQSGQQILRPQAVFVNEMDGRTIPLLIEIGQMGGRHTTRGYTIRVSDITGSDSDQHDAIGSTRAIALRHALEEYAGHFPYGRGYMMVRIPAGTVYGSADTITLRCNPRDTAQAGERLDELLQVLAILGLAIPGVGVAAAAIGAAVSAARLLSRMNNHTFRWDSNSVMDVLNILGAVASGVSRLANARVIRARNMFAIVEGDADVAAWVRRLERFARIADFADDAVNQATYMLGTMEAVQRYLEIQRDEISGRITRAEARLRKAQLLTQSMFDHFMQHAPGVVGHFRGDGSPVIREGSDESVTPTPDTATDPRLFETVPMPEQGESRPRTPEEPGRQREVPAETVTVPAHVTVGEVLHGMADTRGLDHVPVIVNPDLTGNATHVKFREGRLVLEIGPHATLLNVRQHLSTLRVLKRYEGITGYVRRLLDRVMQYLPGGSLGIDTRGGEARLEVEKLSRIRDELTAIRDAIETRMQEINDIPTLEQLAAQRRVFESDILAVTEQLRHHESDINSTAPARGHIGMEDTIIERNIAEHLTPAERATLMRQLAGLSASSEAQALKPHLASSDVAIFDAARFLIGRLGASGQQPDHARLIQAFFPIEFVARLLADFRTYNPSMQDHHIAALLANIVSGHRNGREAARDFMRMYDAHRDRLLQRFQEQADAMPRQVDDTVQQTTEQVNTPEWRQFEESETQALRDRGVEIIGDGNRRIAPDNRQEFALVGVGFDHILATLRNVSRRLRRTLLVSNAPDILSRLSIQFVFENPALRQRLLDIRDRIRTPDGAVQFPVEMLQFFGLNSSSDLVAIIDGIERNPGTALSPGGSGSGTVGTDTLGTTVGRRTPDIIEVNLTANELHIVDLTLRNDIVHQFKTAFYLEVMRALLAGSSVSITATERIRMPDGSVRNVPIN